MSDYVKTFLKDWERLSGSGRFDLNRLKEVMMLLVSNDGALAPKWLDHPLKTATGLAFESAISAEISCWFG
nr:type II toxin-antitoxin system YafQ family toxin [uncultured Pseudomonas sp.]